MCLKVKQHCYKALAVTLCCSCWAT